MDSDRAGRPRGKIPSAKTRVGSRQDITATLESDANLIQWRITTCVWTNDSAPDKKRLIE